MKRMLKLCLIAITAAVVLWSCKDDFTDEDLLNKQAELGKDSIQLSIVVYNASTSFLSAKGSSSTTTEEEDNGNVRLASTQGVAGLTVALNVNGTVTTQTTDANGIAVFTGMQPGIVAGVISGENFTKTNFSLKVTEGKNENGDNEPMTYAGAVIPVFETSGAHVATVTGKVTAELDLLNNSRENVPNGTKVSFSINTSADSFEDILSALLSLFGDQVTNTGLEAISFEGNFIATVQNGSYSINLPVAHQGLEYTYAFSDFVADQKLAVDSYLNEIYGSVRDIQTISTTFKQEYTSNYNYYGPTFNIPYVNSVQVDIAAPPAVGTGATLGVKLLPQTVTNGGGFTVIASGSGYPVSSTTIPVTVVGGDYDATVTGATPAVLTAQSDATGKIIGITGTLGFGYRSQATLTISGPGAGAIVRVNYSSTLAPMFGTDVTSGTTITAAGTGYVVAPSIMFLGFNNAGEQLAAAFATGVQVVNGSLVNFTVPATSFAKAPVVTIIPQNRIQAYGYAYANNIGQISDIYINDTGSGYDPLTPPAVTIRDLRATGSNALAVAETNLSGVINNLLLVSKGSGYSSVSNANFPTSAESFVINDMTPAKLVVKPGSTRIFNAHYGTGIRSKGLNYGD